MSKKIILLTVLGLMLAMTGSAAAMFSLKVDLCFRHGTTADPIPDPATWKGSDPGFESWMPWTAYGDSEAHDARNVHDVGGSGIHIGIASAEYGSFQKFFGSLGGEEKICNSWITSSYVAGGHPTSNTHLVMWADEGLVPGTYEVEGYHNEPNSDEPNMPVADARAYCSDNVHAVYPNRSEPNCHLDNIGSGSDDPPAEGIGPTSRIECNSVISDINDYNIPVQSEALDADLVPSLVRFTTDGNAVWVMYQAGAGGHSVLNAFILKVYAIYKQSSGAYPRSGAENICPDGLTLEWITGGYATDNEVYFGTDHNDVRDANTTVQLGVYIGSQGAEANSYTPPPLDIGTTYYWRVDAVNDANVDSPWKGRVWDFTTDSGQAFDPDPTDMQFSISIFPTLNWTPSCLANSHDVYFGSDFDDVNDANTSTVGIFRINQILTSYFAGFPLLEKAKQYYWRIDEHTDAGVVKGNVWWFFTYGGTLFHYTFDGVMDANIYVPDPNVPPNQRTYMVPDSTGNVAFNISRTAGGDRNEHLLTYGESNPLINPMETSARFGSGIIRGQTQRVGLYRGGGPGQGERRIIGTDITDLITLEYTIEMWIKLDSFFTDDEVGLFRKWDRSYGLTITSDRYVHFWQCGKDPISSDANNPIEMNTWHHVAAVFDACEPVEPQKLYIDGQPAASGGTAKINPDNDDDPVTIGCKVNPLRVDYERVSDAINGFIDELRVSDCVLEPDKFRMRGDPALAWMPRPRLNEQEINYDVILQWNPGEGDDGEGGGLVHDVYFGTAYDDVTDANTTTGGIYKGNQEPNYYDPGKLDLDTTYYWRIDEVVDANGYRWKGNTWSFTVANYIIIDDMEDYDPFNNKIELYWDNPLYTGSVITLGSWPWQPVNNDGSSGQRSMEYCYENRYVSLGYYSEAVMYFDSLQDWVSPGVTMMTLYFYGLPDNDANNSELMYVGLEDYVEGSSTFAKVSYDGDMNDIKVSDWQQWDILLSEFNDVNMADVNHVYIGFGDSAASSPGGYGWVYFDDIRIYPPKCKPDEYNYTADLSGDCFVSYPDILIMGYEWLKSDILLAVSAPPTAPVGHWEMEEGSIDPNDANVADSSVNDYNGIAQGDYSWVAGRIGSSAIEFIGGNDGDSRVLVPDDGNTPLLNPASEVSVAAWIKFHRPPDNYSARVVAKGLHQHENYGLSFTKTSKVGFFVRDSNNREYTINSERDRGWGPEDANWVHPDEWLHSGWEKRLMPDEWTHIAGVFAGNDPNVYLKIYVNGELIDSKDPRDENDANSIILQDSNEALAIGNAVNDDKEFPGTVDDTRVYDYALTDAEVAYIATETTGYVPLVSVANIDDDEPAGQKVVNYKDYAALMKQWLLPPKLWPP